MKFVIPFFLLCTALLAQDKPAYKIFTREGKAIDYRKMINELAEADVILFGEIHDNAIDHWLELEVTKDLWAKRGDDLVLGMEMFEADDQLVLTEYLQGLIEEKHLLSEAKVWENYKTDYKPLVEFAREKKLQVIATNIPRRYANLVYKKGLEALNTLPEEAKRWMAPLPIQVDMTLPGYKDMITMNVHGSSSSNNPGGENMAKAQAVKDATMAYFIQENWSRMFLHFNGTYHSKNKEGIYWYLKRDNPKLKIMTIHSVEQDTTDKLDDIHLGQADFVICIPKDMTKTY
jgi:uncharacterized iron-regulated protein